MEANEALSMWLASGQIDTELAERLRASLREHDEPERANTIIWILVSIGAVLIGGGLLLFIASQWDQSSPARRLALLFGVWMLTVLGAALADRQRLGITARGLWFLSSIAVGVNIFLIGQVFNLPLNYWQGTFLWMIAALAMGWASPSTAQGWLAVPLGILTLGWVSTPSAQFFDQGAFLFDAGGLRPLLPVVGVALVALGILVDDTDFAFLQRPSAAFGALMVSVPVVVSTFHPLAFAYIFQIDTRWFHLVVVALAVTLVGAVWKRSPASPLVLGFGTVAALLLALLPQVADGRGLLDSGTVPWLAGTFDASDFAFGVYSAVIFGLAVATILAGQHFAVRGLVNVGFAAVSVLLLSLYVGRIAGALPTSLAVIFGGLLLVGGAIFLERKRREVTAAVAEEVGR